MKWWFISGVAIIVILMALIIWRTANLPPAQQPWLVLKFTSMAEQEGPGGVEANEGGGTLVLAVPADPAQIDPQGAADPGQDVVLPYLFDTLTTRDADGRLVPALAQTAVLDRSGQAVTLNLLHGVFFQDGSPLNAHAVQFTLQRFMESGAASPIYNRIRQITAVDVVDDFTVRLAFDGPSADLLDALAMPYAAIISPSSTPEHVVGSGPFMLGDWEKGKSLTLIRNNGYLWAPHITQNRMQPHVQSVLVQVMPDAAERVAALQAGQVDVIPVDQPAVRLTLQNAPAIQLDGDAWAVGKRIAGFRINPLGQILINDIQIIQ